MTKEKCRVHLEVKLSLLSLVHCFVFGAFRYVRDLLAFDNGGIILVCTGLNCESSEMMIKGTTLETEIWKEWLDVTL